MTWLLLLPLALAFAVSSANAGPQTADLTVTGTILPPSCGVELLNGGRIDLGSVKGETLNKTTTTRLPPSSPKTLRVECNSAKEVAIKFIDNQIGTVPANADANVAFGLGADNTQTPIGFYTLEVGYFGLYIDSLPRGYMYESVDGGTNWTEITGMINPIKKSDTTNTMYGFDTVSGSTVMSIQTAEMNFRVVPVIQASETLDMNNQIVLSGSTTIELVYL